MERNELYEALEYGKYGKDLCNHTFQLDTGICYGHDYHDRFNGIWLSGLFTLLIKEAGRLCDDYASDMFYDLQELYRDLNGNDAVLFEQDTYRKVIGIRECGVDGEQFVSARAEQEGCVYHYRTIYLITVTPDERYPNSMRKLSCYKVDPGLVDSYVKARRKEKVDI